MSDEADLRVVFRTSQHGEAGALGDLFAEAGLSSETRIVVRAEHEARALELIEAHMKAIGAAPAEEAAGDPAEELLPCPNCEKPGIHLNAPCPGCGYAILSSAGEPEGAGPGALTFCPECRDPLTYSGGNCPKCGETLEPLEAGDRLCPELTHVLYRDTQGGTVCKACRRVWVDA